MKKNKKMENTRRSFLKGSLGLSAFMLTRCLDADSLESMGAFQIIKKGRSDEVYNVLGPTVSFLTPLDESKSVYSVMQGIVPPGATIPLHSHPEDESFYMLSGSMEVLTEPLDNFKWQIMKVGDFLHIPGDVKHAWRNTSDTPVEMLLTTEPGIGRFFKEVGKKVDPGTPPLPPTSEELEHFAKVAARYGHWLASPEENEAVGISLG